MHSLMKMRHSRQRIYIVLCISLITLVLLTALPIASADDVVTEVPPTWEECEKNIRERQGGFASAAWTAVSVVQQCHPDYNLAVMASSIYRFSTYSGSFLVFNGTDTKVTLADAGKGLYSATSVVGLALIFLYFLIEILDEVQADNFTVEHLVKKLLTLMIAIVVVQKGPDIFALIMRFGDAMINVAVSANGQVLTEELKSLYLTLMNAGSAGGIFSSIAAFIECLGILIENLIPYLLFLVEYLIAYLVSFSRFVEVLLRFAFAPLGCAQLVSGGARGAGMRYIKKFASVCLQGSMCVMAVAAQQVLNNQMNLVTGIFGKLILPLTMIGFLMKVGRIADDVVGV